MNSCRLKCVQSGSKNKRSKSIGPNAMRGLRSLGGPNGKHKDATTAALEAKVKAAKTKSFTSASYSFHSSILHHIICMFAPAKKVQRGFAQRFFSIFCPSSGSLRVDHGASRQHHRDWDGEYTWWPSWSSPSIWLPSIFPPRQNPTMVGNCQ